MSKKGKNGDESGSAKNRSPAKSRKARRSGDVEEAPLADEEFGEAETVLAEEEDDDNFHPFAPTPTAPARLDSRGSARRNGVPPSDTAISLSEMDRQYSQTPSLVELKKWREQMEHSELHNLSLHQVCLSRLSPCTHLNGAGEVG